MQHLLTTLPNGYEFVDGVAMHAELGDRFQIPLPLFKKHLDVGHLVEVRIDSPRFSVHPDAAETCECESCREPMTKPVLCHEEPASLQPVPSQQVPSRGWGEQFWIIVDFRDSQLLRGRIDNVLYESPLHGLNKGDEITFLEQHILAIHPRDNREIVTRFDQAEWEEFAQWLAKYDE